MTRNFFLLTNLALLCVAAADKKTYQTVGKEIRNADLITLAYHQALKDFGEGIEDFHAAISYGDLSGEGKEDAAIAVHCRFGPAASANPSDVYVYSLKKGQPVLMAKVGSGEKSHGGICDAYICCDDCFLSCVPEKAVRRLRVQRYKPNEKDCNACYGFVENTQYELRENQLIVVATKSTPIGNLDATDPCTIRK